MPSVAIPVAPAQPCASSTRAADYKLARACKADATRQCGGQQQAGDETVFRCLVAGIGSLGDACAAEVARAARTGLDFYQPVSKAAGGWVVWVGGWVMLIGDC